MTFDYIGFNFEVIHLGWHHKFNHKKEIIVLKTEQHLNEHEVDIATEFTWIVWKALSWNDEEKIKIMCHIWDKYERKLREETEDNIYKFDTFIHKSSRGSWGIVAHRCPLQRISINKVSCWFFTGNWVLSIWRSFL